MFYTMYLSSKFMISIYCFGRRPHTRLMLGFTHMERGALNSFASLQVSANVVNGQSHNMSLTAHAQAGTARSVSTTANTLQKYHMLQKAWLGMVQHKKDI